MNFEINDLRRVKQLRPTSIIAAVCALLYCAGAVANTTESTLETAYHQQIEKVIASGVGHDTQWLRLGHYKPRGPIRRQFRSAYRSEADGAALFIAPMTQAKNDPELELRATLLAFGQPLDEIANHDEANHAQCLFPARRQWAFKKLGWEKVLRENNRPVLPCSARAAWKKQLDAEGVSLVFASAYLSNAASMFGHTFLKFHSRANKDGRDLLDYGVNFAAETADEGGVPFALYGLFGFYPGRFTMQPFHQTLRTYTNLEGRDLIEYRIAFTPAELDLFIDHLFELERTYFDYYFLTENCAYFLLSALEVAKPELNLSDAFWYEVIPADSIRVAARAPGFITGTKYRPSLMALFRAQAERLSPSDVQFAKDVIDFGKTTGWKEASTPALDLALDYGALRATSNPQFDTINYRLRAERASRGGASPAAKIVLPSRPEEGHDPARMGLIYELPTEYESARGRLGLQFRFAYHDRLSNDDGYLRGTTLEVLRTTAFNDDHDPNRIRFREVTLFEILSTQPVDRFAQPISWRAAFGFREPLLAKSLGPFINGGVGSSIALGKFLWVTGLLDGEALSNPDLEGRTPLHVGPRILATAFISHDLKFGFDTQLMRALNHGLHYNVTTAEFAWAPLRNFEMRFGYSDGSVEGTRRSEWSVKLYQHLLL